jgi:Family of unknown function (DUF6188)
MHGLPEGLDLSFFVGKRLQKITFVEANIFFGFEGNVRITAMSSIQHQQMSDAHCNRIGVKQSLPVNHSTLMSLLEKTVTEGHGDEEGTLSLTFNDGQVLRFFDDTPGYESYSFTDGENEYFV